MTRTRRPFSRVVLSLGVLIVGISFVPPAGAVPGPQRAGRGTQGKLPGFGSRPQLPSRLPIPCASAFVQQAQQAVDKYRESTKTPGISVAFYDGGRSCFIFSGNDGTPGAAPVSSDTVFAMGSIEKVFNSTLLALDIVQGKATLDDPAAKYLVAANNKRVKPDAAFSKISLKELVTHTSALPREPPNQKERIGMELYRDQPLPDSVVQFLNSWSPPYTPGTKYLYSNLGFVIVGTVAVEVSQKRYTQFLSADLTDPLGMTRTGVICGSPEPGCAVGYEKNGRPSKKHPVGLWTTARDMLRFIEANLGELSVPPDLRQAIDMTHGELFRATSDHAVGMGWEEKHKGKALLISKDGADSGFASWMGFQPKQKRGVAILKNGGTKGEPTELGQQLLALAESAK